MKRKAAELADGPIKCIRGVMEVIIEQWPYRQQLPLPGFEYERGETEKSKDRRISHH